MELVVRLRHTPAKAAGTRKPATAQTPSCRLRSWHSGANIADRRGTYG